VSLRLGGVSWAVSYQGYWEPSDPDRPGFEIGVAMQAKAPMTADAYQRFRLSGFLRQMDLDFEKMGFGPSTRDESVQEEKLPYWYTFYFKGVHDPGRFLPESRKLLKWEPKALVTSASRRRRR
jgi:hypothetical protein